MTLEEARYVWRNRDFYSSATVDYALTILTAAGEL